MARSILVLIAALPALAQYNAALYNVKPSGGAVGQVCFYETVANGSNKVCLVGPASQAGDTTIDVTTLTSPPFVDSGAIVKGSVDATKLLAFEVDGFTTATTRTVTVPNASFIMAGQNVDNNFSALQSFQGGIDNAPSGGSGNNIKTRVLSVYQDTSTSVYWFFETPSSNTFRLKANDAKPALTFDSSTSPGFLILADNTATSGIAYHFIPGSTAGNQDLGTSSVQWRSGYIKTSLVHNGTTRIDSSGNGNFASLQIGGGTIITSATRWGGDLMPSVDNTHALGGPSLRWNTANIENLTVANCTGCGSGALPVSDSTSIVEDNGDPTKEVRIEASGISTGTVRVWTAPNANITVAGINLAQTWTATQTFGGSTYIDTSGNFNATTFLVGGTTIFTSSRYWSTSAGSFEPSSSSAVSLGSPSRLWSELYMSGAITQSGTSRLSSGGVLNGASFQVAGTEVISSGRIGKFVSLDINGTSNVIDSSRNASVVSLTVNGSYGITSGGDGTFDSISVTAITQGFSTRLDTSGNGSFAALTATGNLTWSGQTRGPYTADTGLSFASSAGKIAYYDTSGNFKGWIPVLP